MKRPLRFLAQTIFPKIAAANVAMKSSSIIRVAGNSGTMFVLVISIFTPVVLVV